MYRKKALEEHSSPEELDKLMQITGPKGWFALAGLAIVVISAIAWGIWGSIPTTVTAQGVLIKSGGVKKITASGTGEVADITVQVGDRLKQGQIVAFIDLPELRETIRETREKLNDLQETRSMLANFQTENLSKQKQYLNKQRRQYDDRLHNLQEQLKKKREMLASRQQLYKQQLIVRQKVLAMEEDIARIQDQMAQTQSEKTHLALQEVQLVNKQKKQLNEQDVKIRQTEQHLDTLRNRLDERRRVTAPRAGRVLELRSSTGDMVHRGDPIISMELMGRTIQGLEMIAYVRPGQGKKIKRSMDAKISPETVSQEKYGFMLGKVKSVSPFPVSPKAMMQVMDNEQLVSQLSQKTAPIQFYVDLVPSANTQSGYRWSSPGGPPTEISPGTLGRVQVTIDEQPPINLVIPKIREFLGV